MRPSYYLAWFEFGYPLKMLNFKPDLKIFVVKTARCGPFHYPIVIALEALTPLQVTVILPIPGVVSGLMRHDQYTIPELLAFLLSNPGSELPCPDGVMYVIEQKALAPVWAITLAIWPGAAPWTLAKITWPVVGIVGVALGAPPAYFFVYCSLPKRPNSTS